MSISNQQFFIFNGTNLQIYLWDQSTILLDDDLWGKEAVGRRQNKSSLDSFSNDFYRRESKFG
ncbi:hypothetical protein A0J48_020505 [Sphaerospermopsis aphanizomenoides BCCUSP55]|uniref:hypothetical protein n=1 Tax=Sphaerospermopsis aphanizomenoides TaxID=459663 RepID=UPI001908E93B|nr:hypothetical protein [Sphaerospermopsis aphanizomenoides]MBK1989882.1 hypothetical protein [Sphaerospermopsis aphanizomenoides BCCUSP55]